MTRASGSVVETRTVGSLARLRCLVASTSATCASAASMRASRSAAPRHRAAAAGAPSLTLVWPQRASPRRGGRAPPASRSRASRCGGTTTRRRSRAPASRPARRCADRPSRPRRHRTASGSSRGPRSVGRAPARCLRRRWSRHASASERALRFDHGHARMRVVRGAPLSSSCQRTLADARVMLRTGSSSATAASRSMRAQTC